MSIAVAVPRINANEDEYKLVSIHVTEGALVNEGDLLFVIESTKAAAEIVAPAAGTVADMAKHSLGEFVAVDSALCRLAVDAAAKSAEGAPVPAPRTDPPPDGIQPTLKAKLRAAELGVNIHEVPAADGQIRVGDVEAYAARKKVSIPQFATSPALGAAVTGAVKAVIIGGGMHAAVLLDTLTDAGVEIVGCIDRSVTAGTEILSGIRVIGTEELLQGLFAEGVTTAYIGIGGATDNSARRKAFDLAASMGYRLPPAISRAARIAPHVRIGAGTLVASSADIGPHCVIGENVIVNTGAIICHHCTIDDDVHLAPGSILAGAVAVGRCSTIGMGATILLGIRIGSNCLVHNGASVVSPLPANTELARDGVRRLRIQ